MIEIAMLETLKESTRLLKEEVLPGRKSNKETKYSYRLIDYDSIRQTVLVGNKSFSYSKLCSFLD